MHPPPPTLPLRSPVLRAVAVLLACTLAQPSHRAAALEVEVIVQNLAAEGEWLVAPVWLGFQDGGFDLYDPGRAFPRALVHLVRRGDASLLAAEFASRDPRYTSAVLVAEGVLVPGEKARRRLQLSPASGQNRFLVFAFRLLSGTGSFVASESPVAFPVFDASGAFIGGSFVVEGRDVLQLEADEDEAEESGEAADLEPAAERNDGEPDEEMADGLAERQAAPRDLQRVLRITVRRARADSSAASPNLLEDQTVVSLP